MGHITWSECSQRLLQVLAQYSLQDAARSSGKYEPTDDCSGQALVHERILPVSPMKKCRAQSMKSLSLSDPQHF